MLNEKVIQNKYSSDTVYHSIGIQQKWCFSKLQCNLAYRKYVDIYYVGSFLTATTNNHSSTDTLAHSNSKSGKCVSKSSLVCTTSMQINSYKSLNQANELDNLL